MSSGNDKRLPISEVIRTLEKRIISQSPGNPLFADVRYKPLKLDKKHFHPIMNLENTMGLCFIDGGNIEIISGPNFIVDLTRLYFCIFRDNMRVKETHIPQRIEFYTVCYAVPSVGNIEYHTEFVPIKTEWKEFLPNIHDLRFDSFDRTIMVGSLRAPIRRVAGAARTFAEWFYSISVIKNELQKNEVLIRDGSLQTGYTNESKYANQAYKAAIKSDIVFTGLSKTSALFTTTGFPLLASIKEIAQNSEYKDKSWFYHPIVRIDHPDHRAEMFVAKLHPQSDYVFRFEILREQADQMQYNDYNQIFSSLASNARDPAFIGYPYGLVDADRFARVSWNEKEVHELQFVAAASKSKLWKKLARCIRSSDAHAVLNRLLGE